MRNLNDGNGEGRGRQGYGCQQNGKKGGSGLKSEELIEGEEPE